MSLEVTPAQLPNHFQTVLELSPDKGELSLEVTSKPLLNRLGSVPSTPPPTTWGGWCAHRSPWEVWKFGSYIYRGKLTSFQTSPPLVPPSHPARTVRGS